MTSAKDEMCAACGATLTGERWRIQGKEEVYCSRSCAEEYSALDQRVPCPRPNTIPCPAFSEAGRTKDPCNPKDAVGVRKWRQYTTVPSTFVMGLGVAMLEGARKYGRHNHRASPVRASIYVDAAKGHIDQFWEGEDIDKDSLLHHILKAGASLAVLYDAIVMKSWVDDRPPRIDLDEFRDEMQKAVDHIFEETPNAKPAFTEKDRNPDA